MGSRVQGEVLSTCIRIGPDNVKITPQHNRFKDINTSDDPFHFQKRVCYKVILML